VHERRRALLKEQGIEFVVEVADQLFRPGFNEAKTSAIFLLEQSAARLGDREFRLFESWLDRVENWSDHDGLTMYLLGPMMAAQPERANRVKEWARSRNLWRRRAAAVSLIRGIRRGLFWREAQQVAQVLLSDHDLMAQKGLGWMLREAAKANAPQTIPFLVSIRKKAPRLVLRTACETLKVSDRKQILNPS
jgi:3-methyladenine DNA glycosylase AlkD